MKRKAHRFHGQASELDGHVWAACERQHVLLPHHEHLVALPLILPQTQNAAEVIENDRRLRKGLREIDHVPELMKVQPAVERQAERSQFSEGFAHPTVGQEMLSDRAANMLSDL